MSQDERHYNVGRLNVIFALASVVLLATIFWMFLADYVREWKVYQIEFRSIEVEKTRAKYDEAYKELENNSEYQEILVELQTVRKEYQANCMDFSSQENEIKELTVKNELISQKYRFTKAELDASKFRYESGRAHNHASDHAQKEYEDLLKNVQKLKLQNEESTSLIEEKQSNIDNCASKLKDVEKKERTLKNQEIILSRKLDKIDPHKMSPANLVANTVRDLPIIDLANPNNKINQVVLRDIKDDVNFMQVPKVERCTSCHLGISNPDYKDAVQPYKAHPNLELFVNKDSAHPIEEFGCTVCHGGRSRGTDFVTTVHTPSSKEQEERWKKEYGWKHWELWEDPMLPLPYVEAGCLKCHTKEASVKSAEKLNLGLHLIEKSGCYGCHKINKYQGWRKVGPNLTHLASKTDENWAYRWIYNPKAFRHGTWMPSFFEQSNSNDPESIARGKQEVHAMVSYLFKNSENYELSKKKIKGDAKKGEELVESIGCLACHKLEAQSDETITTTNDLRTQHGPTLTGLGSKTSKEWIFNWIKDPSSYHPGTRMPNLRLTDQEASDIATFLASSKNEEFDSIAIYEENEEILSNIVSDFLVKTHTDAQAKTKTQAMSMEDKLQYSGKKVIAKYGCYACHEIKGFETSKPIGTDLSEEGSKSLHNLDFGFIHDIDHSKSAWFNQKLLEPRIFDHGKEKAHDEKLVMPNFHFSKHEAEAITTALLGFVADQTVQTAKVPQTPKNILIAQGQNIIQQFNCQACHIIEDEGGAIQSSVEDWLIKYDNREKADAKAMALSFSPPNLIGEGAKVQSKWLFEFLQTPTPIRPWLKVRMPTYQWEVSELNGLLKYFTALDDAEFPYSEFVDTHLSKEELISAEKLFSIDYLDCANCHIVGDQNPKGTPDRWAPNFTLAGDRLRPQWIIDWLMNPADLLPGTKMPTYFDPDSFDESGPPDILDGDEHEQIRVLRNYLMTISDHLAPSGKPAKAPAKEKTSEAVTSQ